MDSFLYLQCKKDVVFQFDIEDLSIKYENYNLNIYMFNISWFTLKATNICLLNKLFFRCELFVLFQHQHCVRYIKYKRFTRRCRKSKQKNCFSNIVKPAKPQFSTFVKIYLLWLNFIDDILPGDK